MADAKISALNALTTAPAVDDVFAIVDTSANETKKITPLYVLALNAGLDALADHGYHGITLTGRNYGYTAAIGDPVYLDDTAWSGTGITLTARSGSFSTGTVYLFVVDKDGNASSGFSLVWNSTDAMGSRVSKFCGIETANISKINGVLT